MGSGRAMRWAYGGGPVDAQITLFFGSLLTIAVVVVGHGLVVGM